MRRAFNDLGIITVDDKFIGINLGYDFTAEHKWGIKKLQDSFGIPFTNDTKLGIEKRSITQVPENLYFRQTKKHSVLVMHGLYNDLRSELEKSKDLNKTCQKVIGELNLYKKYNNDKEDRINYHLSSAWDEGTFGLLCDETYQTQLKELYDHMMQKDCMIMLAAAKYWHGNGLCIAIKSKIPKEVIDGLYEHDVDHINLMKKHEDSGIEKILSDAGKRYFALSPSWKNEEKTELNWWLNPMEQQKYNALWCTYQDLIDWSKDTGPIIMKKEKK